MHFWYDGVVRLVTYIIDMISRTHAQFIRNESLGLTFKTNQQLGIDDPSVSQLNWSNSARIFIISRPDRTFLSRTTNGSLARLQRNAWILESSSLSSARKSPAETLKTELCTKTWTLKGIHWILRSKSAEATHTWEGIFHLQGQCGQEEWLQWQVILWTCTLYVSIILSFNTGMLLHYWLLPQNYCWAWPAECLKTATDKTRCR